MTVGVVRNMGNPAWMVSAAIREWIELYIQAIV